MRAIVVPPAADLNTLAVAALPEPAAAEPAGPKASSFTGLLQAWAPAIAEDTLAPSPTAPLPVENRRPVLSRPSAPAPVAAVPGPPRARVFVQAWTPGVRTPAPLPEKYRAGVIRKPELAAPELAPRSSNPLSGFLEAWLPARPAAKAAKPPAANPVPRRGAVTRRQIDNYMGET